MMTSELLTPCCGCFENLIPFWQGFVEMKQKGFANSSRRIHLSLREPITGGTSETSFSGGSMEDPPRGCRPPGGIVCVPPGREGGQRLSCN
ncbi:hypothetical protein TNIN_498971 [Trichonephila inaurata madagascariensis]|uniref:Uncharacterized protein n=1 Tax=Trichonephila inaurata madagascariensis TaxID=2747483 RepID=A0A8X7BQS1_9ARAC|nr:hypothetical protein TNIN_498971 [Trichonephila inaurata madagascariensis]